MKIDRAVSDDYEMIVQLLDFYGVLLPDRQQEVLDLHYNEDLSFTEIAENIGVSRQAVHDAVKAGKSSLVKFEEKLSLQKKFQKQRELVQIVLENVEKLRLSQHMGSTYSDNLIVTKAEQVNHTYSDSLKVTDVDIKKIETVLKKLLAQL